ncbi:MAG: DUF2254 domain-containing protein [Sandaracinaceae bacterium]|nr:DUF2254 domain-containing protein [Sandaracinaceae bacterium]
MLLGVAFAFFTLAFVADAWGAGGLARMGQLITHPNPQSASNTLSNAGEVVAAVLAIAITVVAIVVELASNRYTHRITELFVAEPINFYVMGFFVITGLQCLWVTLTFDYQVDSTGHVLPGAFVPYIGIGVSMAMLTICLLILLPYFAFVFHFLNPVTIVERIRTHTLDVIKKGGNIARAQHEAVRGVEQLADVALNAMENKDNGISMASVDALFALTSDYLAIRKGLSEEWFRVDGQLAHNPDFVSMAPEVLDEVSSRRIWFEMKVLRQYQTLYTEALNRQRDINYVVAINSRRIAELAIKEGHPELFDLVIKFFNTYLRATINARDVRTAYNVLNQYRLLAENLLDEQNGARATEIARYFKYYGRISFDQKQPFILETVAYDLCTLNELAFDRKSNASRELLRIFLQVDRESVSEVQEASLRGVRKAQVKLATYYLWKGDEALAREVYKDMANEKPERLASIRDELLAVHSGEFWEISDRGQNFDYLSPKRKACMMQFFEWFGAIIPPRASLVGNISSEYPTSPTGLGES